MRTPTSMLPARRHESRRAAVLLVAVLLFPGVLKERAAAEDLSGSPDAAYAVGDAVEDGLGKDLEGDDIRLSDLSITPAKAWAAVTKAADVFGATGAAKRTTKFSDLAPLQGSAGVDPAGKEGLVAEAGRPFGLLADAETVAGMTTLADVAAWIERAENAPVVVVVWSPSCKTCKNGGDAYLNALLAETGARLVALAPAFDVVDSEDEIRAYLDAHPWTWRVVPDADRALTDRFGASLTPTAIVLDAERKIRYRGALYEPPSGGEAAESKEPLREAIEALKAGKPVPRPETEAVGCPIPRTRAP